MALTKNARQQWLGVFLCLLPLSLAAAERLCPADPPTHRGELATVIDGDTLALSDGRRLRLIAVNTPELGRDGQPDQPLARAARRAVREFLGEGGPVVFRLGDDARDHYGRHLAHVYDAEGRSLAAHLLRQGLAWRIAVPPNLAHQECLAVQERHARNAGTGLWGLAAYRPRPSGDLTPADQGFVRLQGTVDNVVETRAGWWLEMAGVSLRLARRDRHYFDAPPHQWRDRRVVVRGWLIDRSDARAVREHGYAPLMMRLRHPSMIETP